MRTARPGGRRGRARGRRRVQPDAARVEGGAARDDRHRIDTGGDAAAEHLADARAQARHQRRAADEHHPRHVVSRPLVLGQQDAHRGQAAVDERRGQDVQLVAGDLQLVLAPAIAGRVRHHDRREHGARQLDLRLLARGPQPRQRPAPARARAIAQQVAGAAPDQRGRRPVDESAVHVLAAQEVVARVIEHAQAAVGRLQQRHVQRAAPEIEHQPGPFVIGAPPGGDGAGDRFLDQDDLLQPREPPGPGRGVVLGQLEQRRRRDHRRPGHETGGVAHVRQQRRDDRRRQLLGQQRRARRLEGQPVRRPHQPLPFAARVRRVAVQRPLRPPADRPPAAGVHAHDGRRQGLAGGVGNDRDRIAIEHRDGRIAGAEVDADVDARSHVTSERGSEVG